LKNCIFIKYYYTINNPGPSIAKMQVKVEDILEDMFVEHDVEVFLHFINCSWGAYYSDFVEVEHTFSLTENMKEKIFKVLREEITFSDGEYEDEEEAEIFSDIFNEHSFLKYCIFRKVSKTNFYSYNAKL